VSQIRAYIYSISMITVLYFARLREALGKASEQIALPAGVSDLEALRALLRQRGGAWADELSDQKAFRVAVNQDMARGDTPVRDGDEIAFFPPVTGG
jgi:molybdopterin synthase sulfur carrier subunit